MTSEVVDRVGPGSVGAGERDAQTSLERHGRRGPRRADASGHRRHLRPRPAPVHRGVDRRRPRRGDLAVCDALARFDGVEIEPAGLHVSADEFERAAVSSDVDAAIDDAIAHLRAFNEAQMSRRVTGRSRASRASPWARRSPRSPRRGCSPRRARPAPRASPTNSRSPPSSPACRRWPRRSSRSRRLR